MKHKITECIFIDKIDKMYDSIGKLMTNTAVMAGEIKQILEQTTRHNGRMAKIEDLQDNFSEWRMWVKGIFYGATILITSVWAIFQFLMK